LEPPAWREGMIVSNETRSGVVASLDRLELRAKKDRIVLSFALMKQHSFQLESQHRRRARTCYTCTIILLSHSSWKCPLAT